MTISNNHIQLQLHTYNYHHLLGITTVTVVVVIVDDDVVVIVVVYRPGRVRKVNSPIPQRK
jgi:hypothetical protein